MQTTIRSYSHSYDKTVSRVSVWKRFIEWCDRQEESRFGWTAGIIMGHGCVITIITVIAILLSGNQIIYWPFAMVSIAASLITCLAALPMRVVLPVFLGSVLLDLAIVIICLFNGFDVSASFR